ncbi:MAG TPA: sigma-70 family RNA polymerase sigma factor [Solirubrobacteraceae bacterium]|jgi:RNA polymerase sigma factor (sigma-70 family)|nr:sigma-70 family RNA polymerase sigma factor [Solirubrobacteraceae bacterium]
MRGNRQHVGELGAAAERQKGELADQALLELVRDGDERAFETLVLRYRHPLRSYCMRLGVPAHSTEDVTQQALLEAWLALRGGAQVHAFKAWLYRVVHNIALDAIRKSPRAVELSCGEVEQAAAMPTEMHASDLQETLSAVASLPLLQREAIVRTALAGESHEQVGRNLGLTAGAVRGLVYRGRTTLRSALAALVPPWLPRLLASRSSAASGLRESLSGIASGAGSTGSAGALVKAGVIVAVAATAITTAIPGHSARPRGDGTPRHAPANPAAGSSGRLTHAAEASSLADDPAPGPRPSKSALRASHSSGPTRSGTPKGMPHPSSQPAAGQPQAGSTGQEQANQPATGTRSGASASPAEASSATAASSRPAGGASSSPAEAPSGSGTQPASGSESTGAEQTPSPPSGSSGSGSSEGGGLVGEVVHTVEKTLETTLENTLGGLLHH